MCLHPIKAWYSKCCDSRGVRQLHFTAPSDIESFVNDFVSLPCGKCIGCLDDRRKRWVNRLLLEFDNSKCGSFITLTYNNDYVPLKPLKHHFQMFMKRFRNIPRDFKFPPLPCDFKYFACGECGGKNGRPHYHALLFGVDLLADIWQPYIATYADGIPRFSSRVLETKWPFGFCTVDSITANRCKYVAKYTMKQEGQEDAFTLKSPRLGVSEFFHIHKCGRKVKYSFLRSDSLDKLLLGNVHVSDGQGRLKNVRIPPSVSAYLDRVSHSDYLDLQLMRQLDGVAYSQRQFDKAAYVERLVNENHKQKLKRKLH